MGMFGQVQHVNTSTPRDTLFMDAAKHEITMPLGSVFLDESSKLSVELTEPGRADAMLTFLLDGKKVTPSIIQSFLGQRSQKIPIDPTNEYPKCKYLMERKAEPEVLPLQCCSTNQSQNIKE